MTGRAIEIEGHSVWVVEEGKGEPIVYLHGFADVPGLLTNTPPLQTELANHYRVITPAHPACSKSDEREDFMKESGMQDTGLNNLIKTGYNTLGLSTFFTSGPEESRAWTIEKKSKAADAAGVIHSDFKKKFIRAETVTHEDFIKYKGFNECKIAGKLRLEGKDYLVNDGDVMYFRVGS